MTFFAECDDAVATIDSRIKYLAGSPGERRGTVAATVRHNGKTVVIQRSWCDPGSTEIAAINQVTAALRELDGKTK